MTDLALVLIISAVVLGALFVLSGIKTVAGYECGIVFRSSRVNRTVNPGLTWIIPGVERLLKVDLRPTNLLFEQETMVTRDSIVVKIDGLLRYRIVDPERAILSVGDHRKALHSFVMTRLRGMVGSETMDDVLKKRDSIRQEVQKLAEDRSETWGIKIEAIEIKSMEIPAAIQSALEHLAEAEQKLAELKQSRENS
jgi:regulator of protease activity HflC (stomatin/prohibitin superfamily)